MYDFDRIVKAAESCDFHGEFASDIKHCENALSMGGLMAINPFLAELHSLACSFI